MNGRAINAEILLRTAKEKAESNDAEDQIVHQKFGLASINRLNKTRFYPLHLAVLNNHLVRKSPLHKEKTYHFNFLILLGMCESFTSIWR
jgi:hypothetical protein